MTNVAVNYKRWLNELKQHIRSTQIKAALKVNAELLALYWHLGNEILEKEKDKSYGEKLIEKLSKDLAIEFPHVKGFSRSNLYTIKQWVIFYTRKSPIVQQAVGQLDRSGKQVESQLLESNKSEIPDMLFQIPWGHHSQILSNCQSHEEAIFYVIETIKNNWSRSMLVQQIENKLWHRSGKAINNFKQTLPAIQSNLAREIIKDPYAFDFLGLSDDHKERELESALMDNLTRFLLELGAGFFFVGRQYPIKVGEKEFAIDLLFYHYVLRCFVVIELKTSEFRAEYTGKLNLYQTLVDEKIRQKDDNLTLGILICKQRNKVVTEYVLNRTNRPIGVSEYITGPLPENFRDYFPTIEQIEQQLSDLE